MNIFAKKLCRFAETPYLCTLTLLRGTTNILRKMKQRYQTPAMTLVAIQPASCMLATSDGATLSGTISGYSANTGGGFSQGSNSAKSNEQQFDDWEEWK